MDVTSSPVNHSREDDQVPTKKKKYYCVYDSSITRKHPWVHKSSKNVNALKKGKSFSSDNYFFCSICCTDFCLAYSGLRDVESHMKSEKHTSNLRIKNTSSSISSHFPHEGLSLQEKIDKARKIFATLLSQNNVPLSVADDFSKAFPVMFPECDVA